MTGFVRLCRFVNVSGASSVWRKELLHVYSLSAPIDLVNFALFDPSPWMVLGLLLVVSVCVFVCIVTLPLFQVWLLEMFYLFIYFKSLSSEIIVILITSQGYHQRLPLQLVLTFHSHCSLKRIDSLCSSFLISIYCMYAAGSLKRKIYTFYILSLI